MSLCVSDRSSHSELMRSLPKMLFGKEKNVFIHKNITIKKRAKRTTKERVKSRKKTSVINHLRREKKGATFFLSPLLISIYLYIFFFCCCQPFFPLCSLLTASLEDEGSQVVVVCQLSRVDPPLLPPDK